MERDDRGDGLGYGRLEDDMVRVVATLLVLCLPSVAGAGELPLEVVQRQVVEQMTINQQLRERNAVLEREVLELQTGKQGVEQRAREQLGLVREGETFYHFVDKKPEPASEREQGE